MTCLILLTDYTNESTTKNDELFLDQKKNLCWVLLKNSGEKEKINILFRDIFPNFEI